MFHTEYHFHVCMVFPREPCCSDVKLHKNQENNVESEEQHETEMAAELGNATARLLWVEKKWFITKTEHLGG